MKARNPDRRLLVLPSTYVGGRFGPAFTPQFYTPLTPASPRSLVHWLPPFRVISP